MLKYSLVLLLPFQILLTLANLVGHVYHDNTLVSRQEATGVKCLWFINNNNMNYKVQLSRSSISDQPLWPCQGPLDNEPQHNNYVSLFINYAGVSFSGWSCDVTFGVVDFEFYQVYPCTRKSDCTKGVSNIEHALAKAQGLVPMTNGLDQDGSRDTSGVKCCQVPSPKHATFETFPHC